MLTRRERLMRTLNGQAVDRPPVNFYEINGLEDTLDPNDPLNIYTDPSWKPLIELAREKTDRIVMCSVGFVDPPVETYESETVQYWEGDSLFTVQTIRAGKRVLTSRTRRDKDVNTVWTLEHLLKDADDLDAYCDLPLPQGGRMPDPGPVLALEAALGESGIVMIDTADPLCLAAGLFEMGQFTVMAMTEKERFHRLLDRFAEILYPRTEAIAQALPGRLWRIYGPEYASEPYLPPRLFHEYVVAYDRPMVEAIQRYGGYARLHSHGRLKNILDHIVATGCRGLDPIEPPPQGDVSLAYVREHYGDRLTLFGNLEASDIENLPPEQFEGRVVTAIAEGWGNPRGFVLQPSACPYGRKLSPRALKNYEKIIEVVERG